MIVSCGHYGPAHSKHNTPEKLCIPERRYFRKEVVDDISGAKNEDCRENDFYKQFFHLCMHYIRFVSLDLVEDLFYFL